MRRASRRAPSRAKWKVPALHLRIDFFCTLDSYTRSIYCIYFCTLDLYIAGPRAGRSGRCPRCTCVLHSFGALDPSSYKHHTKYASQVPVCCTHVRCIGFVHCFHHHVHTCYILARIYAHTRPRIRQAPGRFDGPGVGPAGLSRRPDLPSPSESLRVALSPFESLRV